MTTYPAPTLFYYKAKSKWYVSVTVPEHLRPTFNRKQMRKSTGTADKRIAAQKLHNIAATIYRDFTAAEAVQKATVTDETLDMMQTIIEAIMPGVDVARDMSDPDARAAILNAVTEAVEQLTCGTFTTPAPEFEHLVPVAEKFIHKEYARELDQMRPVEEQLQPGFNNSHPANSLSLYVDRYAETRHWDRDRTKKAAELAITEFIKLIGDVSIADVTKQDAYKFAQHMHSSGKAFKTIKSKVSSVSAMLTWAEKSGDITENPFTNLKLTGYGVKTKKYKPFSEMDLRSIFLSSMDEKDRLLCSILITTGMRLDEAALLDWNQYHVKDGIRYFDLTDSIVKNDGSRRLVPIPDAIKLDKGTGRLFDYTLDSDGKASTSASKHVMKIVRKVTKDPAKVIHSFRGTLKDLLRDAGIPKDVNDFLTGHSGGDVASSYGEGPSLKTRYEALNKVEHPWL